MLARLSVGGVPVADYQDGVDLDPTLAPRPFLHPVTTLSGVTVTDAVPDDHRWHLGVCVGVQDVAGANLWGGRTYVRDKGYTWRGDHGRMRHVGWRERTAGRLDQDLTWHGPDGAELVRERRELAARPFADGWALDIAFTLVGSGGPVELGSPATNGRERAGYGGLFWRLPRPAGPAAFFTDRAEGEDAVHYTRSPWLAYHGDDGDPARPFTLVIAPTDAASAADPWFVRQEGYPGLGSALAAESPVPIGQGLRRAFTALVLDGHLATHDVGAHWPDIARRWV